MQELLSDRVKSVKPSATIAVTNKALELKNQGINVISLGAGEPDFDTNDNIKNAAIKAINEGQTKYTNVSGTKEVKEAIQQKFIRDNNTKYELDEITVGTGGKQIIYNAFMATLNPGDEVIIPAPFWVSYPEIVRLCGATPIIVDCPKENDFLLKEEQLSEALTENTKWIIINSPSNPTGFSYSKEKLEALINVLEKHPKAMIMSDDIYEHITYDDFKFTTAVDIAPHLKNRILTINGVSKAYSMTGWRIGYAGGNAELIKAMNKIQSQSTSNPSSISQAATCEALNGDQNYIAVNNETFKRRRDFVVNKLNNIPGINVTKPNGAFYVFPAIDELFGKTTPQGNKINGSNDFATYLLETANIAVVPGIAFGADNHFRISYATSDENLQIALDAIEKAVEKLKD